MSAASDPVLARAEKLFDSVWKMAQARCAKTVALQKYISDFEGMVATLGVASC